LFCAFAQSAGALAACREAQTRLHEEAWPARVPVRVRMGCIGVRRCRSVTTTLRWRFIRRRVCPPLPMAARCCSPNRSLKRPAQRMRSV
jgi:hypothetical protein